MNFIEVQPLSIFMDLARHHPLKKKDEWIAIETNYVCLQLSMISNDLVVLIL